MLYFTLKYFDPLTPTDTPGFILTEEEAPLTVTKILEISTLVQSVINTHAICLAVPTSFPLNPNTHDNTLFLLENVMLTLKQQLEGTDLIKGNTDNNPIEDVMASLYSHLLTNSSLDFQQPTPSQSDNLSLLEDLKQKFEDTDPIKENEDNTPIEDVVHSLYSHLLTESNLDFQQPTPTQIDNLSLLEDVKKKCEDTDPTKENEDNKPIEDIMTSLYSNLLTNSSPDFQEPTPTPIYDLISVKTSQPKVPAPQKRDSSSNLRVSTSKKSKFSSYDNFFSNHTTLHSETSCLTKQKSPEEYLEKNQSSLSSIETLQNVLTADTFYTLPVIELMPEKDQFIMTPLLISDLESYLRSLHANIALILKDELFFLDTPEDVAKSRTSLFNYTFQTLLSLLHQQEVLITLIPNLRKKEAIQAEHFILKDEVVIRLQAAGFSDNAIINMTASNVPTQLTELHTEDCKQASPKNTQDSPSPEQLVDFISQASSSTQSLSPQSMEDINPVSKNITHYIPLCFIKMIKTKTLASSLYLGTCYTLVYQVKKNNTNLYDCYSNCRETIFKLFTAITNLCDKNTSEEFGLKYICPITKTSQKINKTEFLQRLFIGIQENIEFLKNHHPKLLKSTQTSDSLANLESSLKLIKNKLKNNLPTIQPSDILLTILQEAQKKDADLTSASKKKTLSPFANNKSPPLQKLIIKRIPSKKSSKTTSRFSSSDTVSSHTNTLDTTEDLAPETSSMNDIPLVSDNMTYFIPLCFIKIIKTKTPKSHRHLNSCYTLVYQVKKNNTSFYDCYANCRKTISTLFSAITTLCNKQHSKTIGLNYISPTSKKGTKINRIEMLQRLFVGVQENIAFLKDNHPAFLRPTQIHDPFADLENSLKLLRKKLKNNLPTQQPSDTLLKILKEANKKNAALIPASTKKTVSSSIKKKSRPLQNVKPPITSSEITSIMPIFSSSLTVFSSKAKSLDIAFCKFYYQIKTTSGSSTKLLAHIRASIHMLIQHIEFLLNPSLTERCLVNFKYISPFQGISTPMSQNQALLVLFEGLNENLKFFKTDYPELFIPTKIRDPKATLEKALLLVKKALPKPLPISKEPSILPALLQEGFQKYPNIKSKFINEKD
ncbi:hypothetical protein CLAVI_000913 [Candidatus Clavichlamydia salmonicola]|uniref:hypothetical protein n=1 Tax=Candidatus Clavichlamydia salmonicola TaxID=469812 RepID=UPI0018914896|nr:hypothetical protein [Candidatus Clavichlamydia salmonicola]MBF5051272.1 hypothetical protein [Candidatus Clavichlamydia salmonicola]